MAQAIEVAERQAAQIGGTTSISTMYHAVTVDRVVKTFARERPNLATAHKKTPPRQQRKPYYRCGRTNHTLERCYF